jgi:hypothetical protein
MLYVNCPSRRVRPGLSQKYARTPKFAADMVIYIHALSVDRLSLSP